MPGKLLSPKAYPQEWRMANIGKRDRKSALSFSVHTSKSQMDHGLLPLLHNLHICIKDFHQQLALLQTLTVIHDHHTCDKDDPLRSR